MRKRPLTARHLVLILVIVEDELALHFVKFHILAVEFGGDVRLPVLVDWREFIGMFIFSMMPF